ncbi:hypothetical protein Tco_1407749 [Tanacetum coccineum]
MSTFYYLNPLTYLAKSVEALFRVYFLSDTEIEVIDVHAILPEVALEVEATVVALPTVVLDLTLESGPEVEPSEASLSIDYVPASLVHASASPDYHPGLDTESEPLRMSQRSRLRMIPLRQLMLRPMVHQSPVSNTFSPVQTVEDRLDEQSGMIGGMYEHLLYMPLSKIEEIDGQLEVLRGLLLVSSDRETTSLQASGLGRQS